MKKDKTALITGVTGQDGSYLAEQLLRRGYQVIGMVRRVTSRGFSNLRKVQDEIEFVEADISDSAGVRAIISNVEPDEIYNLAALSFVGQSWRDPSLYTKVNGLGALHVFEAAREHAPEARIYQASSSEQFGSSKPPQDEHTRFMPRSPYGVAKVYAHNMARVYRESYGMHISCGICFNHESPRRGEDFLTRKVARAAARIKLAGGEGLVRLGDMKPTRDWGYAPEYTEAMFLMLQQDEPDDYVLATGETHSVLDFVKKAFEAVGLDWQDHVDADASLVRPAEVFELRGNPGKAEAELDWKAETRFGSLVDIMVNEELSRLEAQNAVE